MARKEEKRLERRITGKKGDEKARKEENRTEMRKRGWKGYQVRNEKRLERRIKA